jgi:hypothetical protein
MRRILLGYESKDDPVAPAYLYLARVLKSIVLASLLAGVSLAVGMAGYAHFERMPWLDAFLNASMILSGMGPVQTLETDAGKLFAGCYAIYSGLVVVLTTGIVLAPIAHRVLHRFHADDDD